MIPKMDTRDTAVSILIMISSSFKAQQKKRSEDYGS